VEVGKGVTPHFSPAGRPRERPDAAPVGQNLLEAHHPETGTAQFLRSSPVEIRRGVYGKATISW